MKQKREVFSYNGKWREEGRKIFAVEQHYLPQTHWVLPRK